MALISITIRDQPDGSVVCQMLDEPQCSPDQTEFTPAQHIAAAALNAIHQQLQDPKFIELAETTTKKGKKKSSLILVGADELPLG
jgi:hypothetical protein